MKRYLAVFMVLFLTLGLLAGCKTGVSTASAEAFYKGQTVDFILSTRVGASTDITGRFLAPYLKEYLGATIVIQNKEQVGSLEGVNYVAKKAKPDGLTFGMVADGAMVPNAMLGLPGVEYDLATLVYLANLGYAGEGVVLVSPDGPYKTIKDLQAKKGLKFGTAALQSTLSHEAAVAITLLKLDAKIVPGFAGTAPLILSTAKGELDAWCSPLGSAMVSVLKKQVKPLLVLSEKRNSMLPDVPAVGELMTLTKDEKDLLQSLVNRPEGSVIFAPPGTPKDRVEFLRQAFDKAVVQPQFKADILKAWGTDLVYQTGAQMTKIVENVMKEKAVFDRVGKLTEGLAAK